jgi:hypothetical protein
MELEEEDDDDDDDNNNNKKCLFQSVNRMQKGYQLKNNSVMDEKGDLLADPYCTLHR